jgi:hypothetical protein
MHTHPALQAHGTCARVEGSVRAGVARPRRVEAVLLAPFNLLLSARAEAVEVIALRPRAIAIEVDADPASPAAPPADARWFVNGGSDASAIARGSPPASLALLPQRPDEAPDEVGLSPG